MRFVDLSMPIWEGAGYGEILAMPNCSVSFHEYMFYDVNGVRMTHLKIDDESGSPFMTPYQGSPHRRGPLREGNIYKWRLDEVPLERLILRDTVVLDVPGEDQHIITAEEIDAAVAQADYREGDDVLVRTSWATTEKAFALGNDYCVYSPSWSYEACLRMAEIMEEKKSGVFMTDAALIMTPAYQGYAWSIGPERIVPRPKPWPSAEAPRTPHGPPSRRLLPCSPVGGPRRLPRSSYQDHRHLQMLGQRQPAHLEPRQDDHPPHAHQGRRCLPLPLHRR